MAKENYLRDAHGRRPSPARKHAQGQKAFERGLDERDRSGRHNREDDGRIEDHRTQTRIHGRSRPRVVLAAANRLTLKAVEECLVPVGSPRTPEDRCKLAPDKGLSFARRFEKPGRRPLEDAHRRTPAGTKAVCVGVGTTKHECRSMEPATG